MLAEHAPENRQCSSGRTNANITAVFLKGSQAARKAALANSVEHNVIDPTILREILSCVIEHFIRAERPG